MKKTKKQKIELYLNIPGYDNYYLLNKKKLNKDNICIKKYNEEYSTSIKVKNKNTLKVLFTTKTNPIDEYRFDKVINVIRDHDLIMLDNIINAGLNIPKSYYANDSFKYFDLLDFNKKYVIKVFLQARSIGKTITTLENFLDMTYTKSRSDITRETFNERFIKFKGECRNDSEEYLIYDNIHNNNNFYIQKHVDVVSEYRLFYTYGTKLKDLVLLKRTGYGLTEDITVDGMLVDIVKDNTKILNKDFLNKMKKLSKIIELPMFSVDIYKDKKGNLGIFEYSPEFSLELNGDILKQLQVNINKSMKKFLMEVL